ncbi:MAG: SDR family NAD(P)-dependent oxidoreductase [Proteobacteria bacterium]|nr:SDR family NAD(P)-dependent oxidoreductase [Pseudomonadota bacterium]MDA0951286.1 SDR family NAD(P)-dependent oxidoreductase [Pseudomonadota bacterium]
MRAIAVQADVASPADVERLFAETDRQLGPVDVLVNNAAISIESPIADQDADTVRRIIDTNLLGPAMTCQQAIRRMSTRRGGRGGYICGDDWGWKDEQGRTSVRDAVLAYLQMQPVDFVHVRNGQILIRRP